MIRTKKSNGLERSKTGPGWKLPSGQNWGGRTFAGGGNRKADHEARQKGGYEAAAPEVYQPDLSGIPRTVTGQVRADHKDADGNNDATSGAGAFRESAYGGSAKGFNRKELATGFMKTHTDSEGKSYLDIASAKAAWGAEEKGGYRALAISDNKRHHAQAEAGWVASGGASASGTINTKDGIQMKAGVGGKFGAYAHGDAKTSTADRVIGGEKYNIGARAEGDVFVGAKAGAGVQAGFGPEFAGAKANAGAFAGAEAQGKIGANLGPLEGTVGGSVMAGAGIGAEGDISYEDGKFHIGGKMFAALGYGGALSGDVTLDVGAVGRSIDNLTGGHLSSAYNSVADGVSSAASGAADVASSAYDAVSDW